MLAIRARKEARALPAREVSLVSMEQPDLPVLKGYPAQRVRKDLRVFPDLLDLLDPPVMVEAEDSHQPTSSRDRVAPGKLSMQVVA